jgi:hypothetical protein
MSFKADEEKQTLELRWTPMGHVCSLEATLPPIFGDIDQLPTSQIPINQIMSQTDLGQMDNWSMKLPRQAW